MKTACSIQLQFKYYRVLCALPPFPLWLKNFCIVRLLFCANRLTTEETR